MIRARSVMNAEMVVINHDTTLYEAAKLMSELNAKHIVITHNGKAQGVFSDTLLIDQVLVKKKSPKNVSLCNLIKHKPRVVSPNTNFIEVEKHFRQSPNDVIAVADDKLVIGIITSADVVTANRDFNHYHQVMQEIILLIFGMVTALFLFYFSPFGQSLV